MAWLASLQLRREVDVQARARVTRQRLRHVYPQGHDRQAHAKSDADRVLERHAEYFPLVARCDCPNGSNALP